MINLNLKDIENLPEREFSDKFLKEVFKVLYKSKFPSKPAKFKMRFNADFGSGELKLEKEIAVNG